MKAFTQYSKATGEFGPIVMVDSASARDSYDTDTAGIVEGKFRRATHRMDLETGQPVEKNS